MPSAAVIRTCGCLSIVIAMLLATILLPAIAALTSTPRPLQAERIGIPTGFDLIGLSVDDAELGTGTWHILKPSDKLHLQAYWQVRSSGLSDNPITWRLTGEDGHVWAQRAQFPRIWHRPAAILVPNEIVQDQYDLPLSAAIPPGRYSLQVSAAPQQPFVTCGWIDLEYSGSCPGEAALP